MEFRITDEDRALQERARRLAEDFAARAAQHDRDATDPVENYAALRDAGFYGSTSPSPRWQRRGPARLVARRRGARAGLRVDALSFNMHLSVVGPVHGESARRARRQGAAREDGRAQGKLIGGNFSEPTTSGLVGTAVPLARARRVDGGYRITGARRSRR